MPSPEHPFKMTPISQEQMDDTDLAKRLMIDVGPTTSGANPTHSLSITPTQIVGMGEYGLGAVPRLLSITSLTGGTATSLDGVVTVSLVVGNVIQTLVSEELQHWLLKVDTGVVENGVSIVIPDDAGPSNLKYWFRIA